MNSVLIFIWFRPEIKPSLPTAICAYQINSRDTCLLVICTIETRRFRRTEYCTRAVCLVPPSSPEMLSVVGDTFCSNSADAWTALTTLTLPISNCQSNVMFMASLVFFVPAFAFSWRQASMIRIRGLTYTPLLRLANSHTGRFARRYEAPQGWANDHVLLLSLQSVCLACWAVMATAECLFEKSNSGPVSFSRIGVLLGEVLQWTLSILFLNVLRRKQATPSFRFLRSFWSIQFALCLGTGILGVEKIWAPPYGSGAKSVEFFSRWGALVACGVLFFISLYGCLYANFDFSDKTSIVQRMAQHRDDGVGYGPPYPDSPVSKFLTTNPAKN